MLPAAIGQQTGLAGRVLGLTQTRPFGALLIERHGDLGLGDGLIRAIALERGVVAFGPLGDQTRRRQQVALDNSDVVGGGADATHGQEHIIAQEILRLLTAAARARSVR